MQESLPSTPYTVTATQQGRYWLATVTNLDGVSTWGYSFSHLDTCVREAIAVADDLPDGAEHSIHVEWTITSNLTDHEEQP